MPRVIGIPLIKGNSDSIVSVQINDTSIEAAQEGQACFLVDGAPVSGELHVSTDSGDGSFYGWIMDINKCSKMASCVRSAESVYLPQKATGFAIGDAVTIDAATGLLDPAGAIVTNGVVVMPDVTEGVDGHTGVKRGDPYCSCIRVSGARDVTPGP